MVNQENNVSTKVYLLLAAGLFIIGLMHLLPLEVGMPFWFGFNHLDFLPVIHVYIFIAATLLLMASILTPIGNVAVSVYIAVAEALFGKNYFVRWIILGVLFTPLFWFLRLPINLLGDGYTIIHNIGDKYPVIYKWTEQGAVALVYGVYKLLPGDGIDVARLAFSLISIVSGGITVFFFAAIASSVSDDAKDRLFIFLMLILSGWMLLFFGYVENYPPLWPVLGGYIYFALRYMKGKSGFITATIFALAGIFLHLQTFFYLVSWPILLFARGRGNKYFKKHKILIFTIGVIVASIVLAAFLYRYFTAMEFRVHFLPLFIGRPKTPNYAILSLAHFRDVINLLFLLLPVWPILIFAALKSWHKGKFDSIDLFLLAFSVGGLLLLYILDPRLGMGRDWDLYALTALAPLLVMARYAIRWLKAYPRTLFVVPLFSLLFVYPFFAVEMSKQPSIDYFTKLLDMRKSESKPGMIMLRDFYINDGQQDLADSLSNVTSKQFPLDQMTRNIKGTVDEGHFKEAMHLADSVLAADPYNADSYNLKGAVFFYAEIYDSAIYYFEQSLRFRPYDFRSLINLGFSQSRLGQLDKSLANLRRAYKYRPDEVLLLITLAESFFHRKEMDSTLFYAEEAIKLDSTFTASYMAAGTAAFQMGLYSKSERYLRKYLQLKPNSPENERVVKILNIIAEKK